MKDHIIVTYGIIPYFKIASKMRRTTQNRVLTISIMETSLKG